MLKTNTKYKNVNMDIIDAIMLDKECEAGIQVHQGGEINMFKEPEMRMLKTTSKGKYDKNVNMDHMMDKKPEMADIMDAAILNTEYEDGIQVYQGGESNMFEEAKTRMLKTNPKNKNKNADIIDAVIFNKKYETGIQVHQGREINMFEEAETRMLKNNPKGKNNAATPSEDPNTVQW